MAGRIVQEIAMVLSLEGSRTAASEAAEGLRIIERAHDAQTAAAGRATTATKELTEAQRAAAVEAVRLQAAEEKTAAAIAQARKAEAAAEAQNSRTRTAQLQGKDLNEAASTAQRAILADRADRRTTVARARFDKEADLLDEPARKAWAAIDRGFGAGGSKGAAGWREAISGAMGEHPTALEDERLRALVQRRLDFEGGQDRIRTFGGEAVERTQREFDLRARTKAEKEKAAEESRIRLAANRARQEEAQRVGAARMIMRDARATAAISGVETVPVDRAKREGIVRDRQAEVTRDSDAALRAIEAEIRATERLEKAVAKVAQERKRKDELGVAGAELAEKHARREADDAAQETRTAIDAVLKTLSADEREAFALMESAVARMTAKGVTEMGAWRMAARQAAKGVREELGAAMRGPNLSRLSGALANRADFATAAVRYREVASSVDMVSRSARRASGQVRVLNHNLTHGFSRSLAGVNELAGGIGQFLSFSFGAFRNVTFLVRTLTGALRGMVGVVRGAVRAVSSLARGVVRLGVGLGRLVVRTGVGFLSGAMHAMERLTGLVRGLVHEVERATAGLVRMSLRAASAAVHWGKWAAVGAVGIGVAAGREGYKDSNDLADTAEGVRKASEDTWETGKSGDQKVSRNPEADAHPGEMGNVTGMRVMGSLRSGTDTDMAQALKGLAERNDVAGDKLQEVIKGLGSTMREAINDPNSPQAALLRQMHVALTERGPDGRVHARNLDDVFRDVSRATANVAPGAKAALYEQLFGSADAVAVDPVMRSLANGGDRKEIERQKELGTFVSKQDIADAREFRKVITDLKDAFRGVRMEIGRQLMPYVRQWSRELTTWLVEHRGQIAGMVTRTVVAARRIGLTLLEKAREVAYGLFVLYERFASGQTILQRFVAYLDRIDLASRVYRFGFQSWVTYLVLVKREVQEIARQLHARGVGNDMFGLNVPAIGRVVFALMQLEMAATKAGFAIYDLTARKLAVNGGWAKVKSDVAGVASSLWGAAKAVYHFGQEFVRALGGTEGIERGLRQVGVFVREIGTAVSGFMQAHGLNHGDTWARMFITLGNAVAAAYRFAAPHLKAFAHDLKVVLTGDEWGARDSKALTKLVDLRNRLVAWAKAALADLKAVFTDGQDADGIQTWVGSVAKWMLWVVSQLPTWWEQIKKIWKEGSDFVATSWHAMVAIIHGEKSGIEWLDALVEKVKLIIDWIGKLFEAFKTLHGWMDKFKQATGWDIESGLLLLGIGKMTGILGLATGAWKLLTGAIQGAGGVLQAFIALCRGDLAGVLGMVRSALGLSGAGGAAGIAEGAAAVAGTGGMVGMGPGGAAMALGGGAGAAGAGSWAYRAGRGLAGLAEGGLSAGMSAGVLGLAAEGGLWSVEKMRQNADEEADHVSDMQDLRAVTERVQSQQARGLFNELSAVYGAVAGDLTGGKGSESWNADVARRLKTDLTPQSRLLMQRVEFVVNGDTIGTLTEDGVFKAIHNSKYALSSQTANQ